MSTPITPGESTPRPLPPSKTPEARRLARFTKDSRYGPKLNQLPKGEQTRLLDMIRANQGKQARQDLLTTHAARRDKRNTRARELRLEKSVTEGLRNVGRQIPEARVDRMGDKFSLMSPAERKFAKTATRDELKERARNGPKTVTIDGVEYNPFWYG